MSSFLLIYNRSPQSQLETSGDAMGDRAGYFSEISDLKAAANPEPAQRTPLTDCPSQRTPLRSVERSTPESSA